MGRAAVLAQRSQHQCPTDRQQGQRRRFFSFLGSLVFRDELRIAATVKGHCILTPVTE
jgi:hypothetical protein